MSSTYKFIGRYKSTNTTHEPRDLKFEKCDNYSFFFTVYDKTQDAKHPWRKTIMCDEVTGGIKKIQVSKLMWL